LALITQAIEELFRRSEFTALYFQSRHLRYTFTFFLDGMADNQLFCRSSSETEISGPY